MCSVCVWGNDKPSSSCKGVGANKCYIDSASYTTLDLATNHSNANMVKVLCYRDANSKVGRCFARRNTDVVLLKHGAGCYGCQGM